MSTFNFVVFETLIHLPALRTWGPGMDWDICRKSFGFLHFRELNKKFLEKAKRTASRTGKERRETGAQLLGTSHFLFIYFF